MAPSSSHKLVISTRGLGWLTRGGIEESSGVYAHFSRSARRESRAARGSRHDPVRVAPRYSAPIASQRPTGPRGGRAAPRPDHVGQLVGKIGMAHQLDPIYWQQRLPIRCSDVPLAAPIEHPMGQ